MASTHKHIRSSTANKRPTTAIADGQIALNTNSISPGLFFKDSTGATIIKIGPVHIGATAPNASPAAGGSAGNSTGEIWLDNSLTPVGVKIWDGSAWVNATPIGSTTVQGLLELATNAETQTGADTARAVTPAGLQSKLSDSTSTTSSTTIASSTAVKSAYDLANAALPKSGGTVTGNLEIGTTGSLSFEGATADAFETTIAVVNPTADRTITLPDTTGTIVTTGDTGTVTSTMIADGTIVNADVNASAAIAGTKISPDFGSQTIATTGIVSHALGTAGAPTVTFTGNTNTGIYSPGADQVAISTNGSGKIIVGSTGTVNFVGAGTAGSTQAVSFNGSAPVNSLVIDSSGRVGIGTSTPTDLLTVAATAPGIDWTFASNTAFKHSIVATGYATSPASGNSLAFRVASGSGTQATVMHLNGAGQVGVGTSSPSDVLHVEGVIRTSSSGSNAQFANNYLRSNQAGTFYFDQNSGSQDFAFRVSNVSNLDTTAMTIKSSGRVGVGTTSPDASYKLTLSGNRSTVAPGIFFNDADASPNNYSLYINGSKSFVIRDATISSDRLTVDSSGRLLVGTSSSNGVNSNTAPVLAGNFVSFTGSVSANSGTATTLFSLENLNATYMITAVVTGTANAGAYHAVYIVGSVASNSHSIQALKAGSLLTLSLSGANVQATQSSGVSQTITWSVTRMANL